MPSSADAIDDRLAGALTRSWFVYAGDKHKTDPKRSFLNRFCSIERATEWRLKALHDYDHGRTVRYHTAGDSWAHLLYNHGQEYKDPVDVQAVETLYLDALQELREFLE